MRVSLSRCESWCVCNSCAILVTLCGVKCRVRCCSRVGGSERSEDHHLCGPACIIEVVSARCAVVRALAMVGWVHSYRAWCDTRFGVVMVVWHS